MEEDFALTCRGEVLDMKDQAGELDWFNQKFVVLRAISTSSSSTSTSTSKSRMRSRMPPGLMAGIGIVPPLEGEVVVIDGEDGEGEGGKGGKDKKMKEVVVID